MRDQDINSCTIHLNKRFDFKFKFKKYSTDIDVDTEEGEFQLDIYDLSNEEFVSRTRDSFASYNGILGIFMDFLNEYNLVEDTKTLKLNRPKKQLILNIISSNKVFDFDSLIKIIEKAN